VSNLYIIKKFNFFHHSKINQGQGVFYISLLVGPGAKADILTHIHDIWRTNPTPRHADEGHIKHIILFPEIKIINLTCDHLHL
jgi:hypothetical protein